VKVEVIGDLESAKRYDINEKINLGKNKISQSL
jgi:hypothetical protein